MTISRDDIQRALSYIEEGYIYEAEETIRTVLQDRLNQPDYKAMCEEQNRVLLQAKYFEEDNFKDGYGTATPAYIEYWDNINNALSKYQQLKGER